MVIRKLAIALVILTVFLQGIIYMMYTEKGPMDPEQQSKGEIWALLISGDTGYQDHSNQANLCAAYHLLKAGGLKDSNIIVFLAKDLAYESHNKWQGHIYNRLFGGDVYAGVPWDYTGSEVTVANIEDVLFGKSNIGKKSINSKPEDRIFIYFIGHGSPKSLLLLDTFWSRKQLQDMLKAKPANTYESMVIYIDACHSGGMFKNFQVEAEKIYAVTSSSVTEKTFADNQIPIIGIRSFTTYFSQSWMSDSLTHDRSRRTLEQQLNMVRSHVSSLLYYPKTSHVQEFGNLDLRTRKLSLYQGYDPRGGELEHYIKTLYMYD